MSILYKYARDFGLELDPTQEELFEKYYALLIEWNERFNLTAITDYTQVQLKHFADSLSAAPILCRAGVQHKELIDVGAGAGMPGLALAIALPDLRVTLLEATGKKVRFLDQAILELGLENVSTVQARAEEFGRIPAQRERYDFAVARAVAPLRTLVEYALPFVKVGGVFVAYKAVEAEPETKSAQHAVSVLGGHVREIIPVELGDLEDVRRLVVIDKQAHTPGSYPRGGGRPRSKPL